MSSSSINENPTPLQADSQPQAFAPGLLPEDEKEWVDLFWNDGSGETDDIYAVPVHFTHEEDPTPTLTKLRAMGYTINSIEVLIGPIDSDKEGKEFAERLADMGLFVSSHLTASLLRRKGQPPLPPEWRKRLDEQRSRFLEADRQLKEQRRKEEEEYDRDPDNQKWFGHEEPEPEPDPQNLIRLPDPSAKKVTLETFLFCIDQRLREIEEEKRKTEGHPLPMNVLTLRNQLQVIEGGLVPA